MDFDLYNGGTMRKQGSEPFLLEGQSVGFTVQQFWQWSASDLMDNTLRGRLAEYIIATALGIDDSARAEWEAFDLLYKDVRIEVKSSAYVQSWYQKKPSSISFGIQPTVAWEPKTGIYSKERKRQADLYIFSLLEEQKKEVVNPLNLNQWKFYLLPAKVLDAQCEQAKRITLSRLVMLHPIEADYAGLKGAVEQTANLLFR